MSAGISGGGQDNSQDFELNLASIIDCFTVLIAFMLASAAYLSIGILDAGVAAAGATASSEKPPAVNVTVELDQDQKMVVKLSGKVTNTIPIEAQGGKWNYEALTQNLTSTHSRFNDVNAVTLTANNAIAYKDVVKTMEVIRKTMPVVLLGGF
jgi:biopolymer transport protein ExbD